MKSPIVVVVGALVLASTGCESMLNSQLRAHYFKTHLEEKRDDFTGKTTREAVIFMGTFAQMTEAAISFKRELPAGKTLLSSYVYRSGWIFIDRIAFKIDGTIVEYRSMRDTRNAVQGPYVEEVNWYDPDLDLPEKLRDATTVKVRLTDRDFFQDFELPPARKEILGKYILP